MSYVKGGWRSGQASDFTGAASTATVSSIDAPTTRARRSVAALVVNGTGFTTASQIVVDNNVVPTVFNSATKLTCTAFSATPDNGVATSMVVKVRKQPSEQLTGTSATITITG